MVRIRTKIDGVRVLNPWFQHPSERFAVFLKSLKYMMLEKRPRETRRPFAPRIQGFLVLRTALRLTRRAIPCKTQQIPCSA
jgi:hypothetical protein